MTDKEVNARKVGFTTAVGLALAAHTLHVYYYHPDIAYHIGVHCGMAAAVILLAIIEWRSVNR